MNDAADTPVITRPFPAIWSISRGDALKACANPPETVDSARSGAAVARAVGNHPHRRSPVIGEARPRFALLCSFEKRGRQPGAEWLAGALYKKVAESTLY